MWARFCELKSPINHSAAAATAANNDASFWPAFANAQAVLATFCSVKSLMCCSAAVANAAKTDASLWSTVTTCPAGKRIALRKISNVLHSLYCISFLFLLFLHLALQKRRDHAQTQISDAFRSCSPWQTPATGFIHQVSPSKLSEIEQKSTKIKTFPKTAPNPSQIESKRPLGRLLDPLGPSWQQSLKTVSYTHLTLPTILRV